jgi:polar amino acid transport system permease protein
MYFAIPLLMPAATFSRGFTAIVGLSVYAGAYMAEIVRGSIEAIPKGQTEAAQALGMKYVLRLRYIILPQAMKIAVPPGIGFLISLVKASSLVSVIGYIELTKAGRIVSTLNQEPLLTFLVVAALYFLLSYPIALFGRWYERRLV